MGLVPKSAVWPPLGNTGHAVDYRQGDQAFACEWFHVGPQGGEVVGSANRENGDAVGAGLGDQQVLRGEEGRLGEAVVGVYRDPAWGAVFYRWDCFAVYPAAG